ncbi:MAG: alcohol dehydrogenase catalytic domain-containing protein [Chloroflexi bacterium]|nr:alcohol dehydrogenase catalytic domain-containing protein [Chloroflexota bacterium]
MKSLKLYGPRDLRLVEEPVPQPQPGEALLRVRAVTVCHSDIHYYRDGRIGNTVSTEPLVLGHEFCGEVVQAPAGDSHLRVGDLVAVEPAISCGRCRFCQEGNPNLCEHLFFAGVPPMDGGLREYVTYKPEFLFPLPANFTAEDGAMLEPLGVALHSWDLAHFRMGDTVAIVGCGPIGLLMIQLARIAGATEILAVEPLAYRRDLAAELGARPVSPEEDLERFAAAHTRGYGVDVAIEVAGAVPAQEEAARTVRNGGRLVMVGIPPEDQLLITHHVVRRKGLTIRIARRMKLTYPRAIALVERQMVDVRSLVTHRFALEQGAEAFELVAGYGDGIIKAVVCP